MARGALRLGGRRSASMLIAAPNDAAWCRDALCAGAERRAAEERRCGRAAQRRTRRRRRIGVGAAARHGRLHPPPGDDVGVAPGGAATLDRSLSRREREIFRHAASGLANKELASRLAIGEATVKAHLTHIFQKLGVRGRAELAALYHGVTPPCPKRRRRRACSWSRLPGRPTKVEFRHRGPPRKSSPSQLIAVYTDAIITGAHCILKETTGDQEILRRSAAPRLPRS